MRERTLYRIIFFGIAVLIVAASFAIGLHWR